MNKQTKIVLAVIAIVAIVGGIWYYKRNKQNKQRDEKIEKDLKEMKENNEIIKQMYPGKFSDSSNVSKAKEAIDVALNENENKSTILQVLQLGLQNKDFTKSEYDLYMQLAYVCILNYINENIEDAISTDETDEDILVIDNLNIN